MPRDLDGPTRDKRRERDAPSGRNAVRPANTRDIDTSSVRETISRSRLQGVETEADGGGDPYGLDAEPRRDAPARSQNRRADVRGDGGEDIRRVFDEQRHEGAADRFRFSSGGGCPFTGYPRCQQCGKEAATTSFYKGGRTAAPGAHGFRKSRCRPTQSG